MTKLFILPVLLLVCFAHAPIYGDEPTSEPTSEPATQPAPTDKKHPPTTQKGDTPVVTEHELKLPDTTFKYKTTTGFIPLKDAKEKLRAKVFFISYARALDDETARKD